MASEQLTIDVDVRSWRFAWYAAQYLSIEIAIAGRWRIGIPRLFRAIVFRRMVKAA